MDGAREGLLVCWWYRLNAIHVGLTAISIGMVMVESRKLLAGPNHSNSDKGYLVDLSTACPGPWLSHSRVLQVGDRTPLLISCINKLRTHAHGPCTGALSEANLVHDLIGKQRPAALLRRPLIQEKDIGSSTHKIPSDATGLYAGTSQSGLKSGVTLRFPAKKQLGIQTDQWKGEMSLRVWRGNQTNGRKTWVASQRKIKPNLNQKRIRTGKPKDDGALIESLRAAIERRGTTDKSTKRKA